MARAPAATNAIQRKWSPPGWTDEWKTFWPQLWDERLKNAKFIDLTHSFGSDTPVWPGFGEMSVGAAKAGPDMSPFIGQGDDFEYAQQGFIATEYKIPTDQIGTQLDPPAHWNEYGATISDIPPTYSVRPLVIINVADKTMDDVEYEVTLDDIEAWEEQYGTIPFRSVVFFRTDWSKKWDEYKEQGSIPLAFPGIGLEVLKYLHNTRRILFHGHEPLDTDSSPTLEGQAWLMHNHFAQAEGLKNLDQVSDHGCLVVIGFAKPKGGTGGFARYVAMCPGSGDSGGTTIEETPGAPLAQQTYPLRRRRDGALVPTQGEEDSEYCLGPNSLGCLDGNPTWIAGLPA